MDTFSILYEDDDMLVLDKPSGLAVQGGEGVRNSVDALLAARYEIRPLLVHRLDKDTSGVLLVAKGKQSAARLSALLRERQTSKEYLAFCGGRPFESSGVISDDIVHRGSGKTALTRFLVVASHDPFSLLSLELGTGRMHQIRIHLAGRGCPILGDDKYGDFRLNKELRKTHGVRRLLLHAHRLSFVDRGRRFSFLAPPPPHFLDFGVRSGIGLDAQ